MVRSEVSARFLIAASIALALAPALPAQEAPAAEPALQADQGNDLFARAHNLYQSAKDEEDRGTQRELYQRAIPIFEQYIRLFPDHPNSPAAWYYLGQSHYMSGSVDLAKRCFHIVLNRFGDGRWVAAAAYQLAVNHYTQKEYALAAPLFEKVAANAVRDQDRQRALYFLATCHHLEGQDAKALAAYRRVLDGDDAGNPYRHSARLAIGHLLAKSGKAEAALEEFQAVAETADRASIRGEAMLHAGLIAARLERPELADRYLRQVLDSEELAKFRPEAQIALMGALYQKGNFKEVVAIFHRSDARAEGAKEARRLSLAGMALMKLERWTDALKIFREVERAVPAEHPLAFEASYNRILCFYNVDGRHVPDQVDAFLAIYRDGRPKDPKIHTALMMKAETLYANGNIEAAAEAYGAIDASLVSESNRPGLLYQRGWALADSGDHQRAVVSLGKFIENFPKDPRLPKALAKRGDSFLALDKPAAALRDFDRLIAMQDEPEARDLASFAWQRSARIKKEEGDLDGMVARYQSLVKKFPHLDTEVLANAHYWIGWGLFKSNKTGEAEPHLRKARELDEKTYGKQSTLLLVLSLFSREDVPALAKEVDLAIEGGSSDEVPEQVYRWLGNQLFNDGQFTAAARYLTLGSTPSEPRQTPKAVWRYLAKALIEIGEPKQALDAVEHVLEVEEHPQWKADALLDRSRALLALNQLDEAEKAAAEASQLRPEGRVDAQLRLNLGDIEFARKNYKEAAAQYVVVAQLLVNDQSLEPLALDKARLALELAGDEQEAAKYRTTLENDFPDYEMAPKPDDAQ